MWRLNRTKGKKQRLYLREDEKSILSYAKCPASADEFSILTELLYIMIRSCVL